MRCALTVYWLLLVIWAGQSVAAGVREVGDGWLSTAAENERMLTTVRAGVQGPWCTLGQANLYGLAELPLRSLDAGIRIGTWQVSAGWHRTGSGLLTVDRVQGRLVRRGRWRIGFGGLRETTSVEGARAADYRLLVVVLGRHFAVGDRELVVQLDLPLMASRRVDTRRLDRLARAALVRPGLVAALACDRRGDGTPFLGAEITFGLTARLGVGLRVDGMSGSLGPGLVVRTGPLLLRTSHLVHPALGVTHRFQITAGARGATGG